MMGLLGVVPAVSTMAASKTLYTDAFAAGDLKGWTLQPPINALGPIPTKRTWKTEDDALVATGTAAPWTIQTGGDASWTDYELSAKVTIRQPTPKATFPIFHGEYDRYLPREWFPPVCDHTGIYRFRYFAGEFDWGSDAAVYVRYQNRENCYRVQLSSEYQEMILWHSVGGYLQVVPCKVEPGKTYKLEVRAQGAHLQVYLNGKKTIDYWHECLPTLTGGIGLGAYNSTVAFKDVTVTPLSPPSSTPAHEARFTDRQWRGQTWIFDGNEPICLWEINNTGLSPDYGDGVPMFHQVKLRPGYRPMYQTFVSVRKNEAKTALTLGKDQDVRFTGRGTGALTLTYDGLTSDTNLATHTTDVLTYDTRRGTYRHDFTVDLTFNKDEIITALEFSDPLTYNNKEPGRGVKYPWLPAGHKWGLMRCEDGSLTHHPISQSLNMEGQNSWYLQPGNGLWVLYPDRAVCPAFEHHTPNERTYVGVCHWGFDWHQYLQWAEKARNIKAGTKLAIRYALTGYTPAESEVLFLASKPNPQMVAADNSPKDGKPLNVFKVPSPYAFAVCDPAGTSFDEVYSVREPYVGWQFYGDYQLDRTMGRTDRYSMRLDGPAKVVGMIYHHMIDNHTKRYLCTVWLKTKGVQGDVTFKLYYPWQTKDRNACDTVPTGLKGDNDWQEISFISTVPTATEPNYDASEISVEIKGLGTVWVDDFSLRGIEDNEQVTEHRPVVSPAVSNAAAASADFLLHLPCKEGQGDVLVDASGHGNHAKLYHVNWATDNGRPVLRFNEKYCGAFVNSLSPELQPAKDGYPLPGLTLDAWVKPTGDKGGDVLGFFYSPRLTINPVETGKVSLAFNVLYGGKWETLLSPSFATGTWTHVAGVIDQGKAAIYVNGKVAKEATLAAGKLTFTHYDPEISVGTYVKFANSSFTGDMKELRWWSRAATAAEIAAAAAGQP